MNSKEFKNILDQYGKGQLDKQTEESLLQWLEGLEDKTAFDQLLPEELETTKVAMFRQLERRIHKPKIFRLNLKVAATIAVLIIAGFIFKSSLLNLVAPHRKLSATSIKGKITKQILSDGTIVWLKGESRLTYPASFGGGKRTVTLEGEALFEVTKDVKHPFIIYCGPITTQVLGTSFNIKQQDKEIAVSVLTGAVSVAGNILREHENAIYSEARATVKKGHATTEAVREFTKGTEYDMAFNDVSMNEVISRIEKKFEVTIQLSDTSIGNSLFTADMTDLSLRTTMEMISQALNLDVEINGKTVLLQPKKN